MYTQPEGTDVYTMGVFTARADDALAAEFRARARERGEKVTAVVERMMRGYLAGNDDDAAPEVSHGVVGDPARARDDAMAELDHENQRLTDDRDTLRRQLAASHAEADSLREQLGRRTFGSANAGTAPHRGAPAPMPMLGGFGHPDDDNLGMVEFAGIDGDQPAL